MKSEYIEGEIWNAILGGMTPANARAVAVSLETGMRIGDVLKIRVSDLTDTGICYVAEKTGKQGFAPCNEKLLAILRTNAAGDICFPSRFGAKGEYRSRQAVWKNVRKAATYAGIKPHISPHSARKTFAVDLRRKKGVGAVQEALQHKYNGTTNLYAFADVQGLEFNHDRIVSDTTEKVLARLGELLGMRLTEPPPLPEFSGEEDLQ